MFYKCGVAAGDITPPVGAPLCGFAARKLHTSAGIYRPLRVVCLAVDDGNTPLLIVSAEIIFFESIADRVRISISQATGVPRENIILNATHTHCGPAVRTKDIDIHGWIDHVYVDHFVRVLTATAHTAWKNKFSAILKFYTGTCSLACCRRKPDSQHPGRILRSMLPYKNGISDHQVPVLTAETEDGIIRAVVFNYACHPTSRGGLLIGGDFPGFAYEYLDEAFPNALHLFLQGCGADQKPRPYNPDAEVFERRTIEQTREGGYELGRAVENAVNSKAFLPVHGHLSVIQKFVNLQTEPLDHKLVEEYRNDSAEYKKRWADYHKKRIEMCESENRTVVMELQTVRFGNSLAIPALAAEAVVEHSIRLKNDLASDFAAVMPLAYINHVIGYVPVKRQFDEYGYEVIDANMSRLYTGRFIPENEDIIHSAIQNMFRK